MPIIWQHGDREVEDGAREKNSKYLSMRIKSFLLLAFVNFLFTSSALSQTLLSFSDDTIVVESCDDKCQLVGIIEMYTHTKEKTRVRWDITKLELLDQLDIFLIIDPIQYVPYTTGAFIHIWNDTTDILFHMCPDTLLPGDTALIQLGVYDTKDSVGTYQLLTTILSCPLSSATIDSEPNEAIRIYPNPFNFSTRLQTRDDLKYTHLNLYNVMGQFVRSVPINSSETEIYRDGLPEGLYFICVMDDQIIRSTVKVVVTD